MAYRNIISKFQSLQIKDLDPEELRGKVAEYLNETTRDTNKKPMGNLSILN
jgi:hypothetical protein